MKRELTHGSLFSGVEGFGLGAALAGIKTEWSCEFEKYQTKVIKKKILEMDTQYMEILERLKTRHLLTSSAADSLARTSALLEKAQELREAGLDYGDKRTELLEKSDPIMSLSKIALYLENEDSNTSYMDFPKSGMMHSGSVYKVPSLDCNNAEKGYIYIIAYPVCKFGEGGVPEIGFSAALPTVGTSTSISGMGRATGFTRTPNSRKH